jgi:predicted histidine transporter YuiF (NhaC family)
MSETPAETAGRLCTGGSAIVAGASGALAALEGTPDAKWAAISSMVMAGLGIVVNLTTAILRARREERQDELNAEAKDLKIKVAERDTDIVRRDAEVAALRAEIATLRMKLEGQGRLP